MRTCVRTTSTHHSIDRSIDHCRCSKIHMYSEFRSCMHYSLICSSLALLAMDRSMRDSSVRPSGMLPTCMLLGGSKNTWMHACMCMDRINNKWPLHEIPATWYCTGSTASHDYATPSFSFYLLSRRDNRHSVRDRSGCNIIERVTLFYSWTESRVALVYVSHS